MSCLERAVRPTQFRVRKDDLTLGNLENTAIAFGRVIGVQRDVSTSRLPNAQHGSEHIDRPSGVHTNRLFWCRSLGEEITDGVGSTRQFSIGNRFTVSDYCDIVAQ